MLKSVIVFEDAGTGAGVTVTVESVEPGATDGVHVTISVDAEATGQVEPKALVTVTVDSILAIAVKVTVDAVEEAVPEVALETEPLPRVVIVMVEGRAAEPLARGSVTVVAVVIVTVDGTAVMSSVTCSKFLE